MLYFLLLAAAQPAAQPAETPVDPATMSAAQRRAVDAIGAWMQCVAPQLEGRSFASEAAADAAADSALAACRAQERSLHAAFAAGISRRRADALVADFRRQTRGHARAAIGAAPAQ